jgi:uncharacterized membrane protein
MTKLEFLSELKNELKSLPKFEVDEILRDQDEYISDAIRMGRQESEVIDSLGKPKVFAKNLIAETHINSAFESEAFSDKFKNVFRALFAVIALAPLNLIFVLGPFVALCAVLFAGWVSTLALLGSSLFTLGLFFKKLIFIEVGIWAHLSTLFFTLGTIGLAVLSVFFVVYISKCFASLTISYLKWNMHFIRGRS